MLDFNKHMYSPKSIAPLVTFRILFGAIMTISIFRFYYHGWITELYVDPSYYFTFYGFDWIKPLGNTGMHLAFLTLFLAAIAIAVGAFYRFSITLFFLVFTYIELIDKTNYLNHYYFVSIVSFLLIWLPAGRKFSLDCLRQPSNIMNQVPAWNINVLKLQLAFVYIFAGIAKLTPSWIIEAMPLKLWLPSLSSTPIIGGLLQYEWMAYFFSWSGALYDLSIVFFLLSSRCRPLAYLAVVLFHIMTALLFQIGMFPYIMILCTTIFFSGTFHEKMLNKLGASFANTKTESSYPYLRDIKEKYILTFLVVFFCIQILLPFRYLLYPGDLYWTEQGYRFSWRVMLMEKAGHATFLIKDTGSEKVDFVKNYDYLSPQQEKMMSTQADMILQYAHHLADVYKEKGFVNPQVNVQSKVTLNGRRSKTYIDPAVDLSKIQRGWRHKDWILPLNE